MNLLKKPLASLMFWTLMSSLTCALDAENGKNTDPEIARGPNMTVSTTGMVAGKKFLIENQQKTGIITRPSGLQYKITRAGSGPKPQLSDRVTVHYSGRLINGIEFDSSYSRGKPISFSLTEVISGWTEALQLMNVGSNWEVYIPSNLAYGSRGAPPTIGADETLIFKIELIGIAK